MPKITIIVSSWSFHKALITAIICLKTNDLVSVGFQANSMIRGIHFENLENYVGEASIQRYLIVVEFFQFHTVLLLRLHMCVTSDAFWYPVTSAICLQLMKRKTLCVHHCPDLAVIIQG